MGSQAEEVIGEVEGKRGGDEGEMAEVDGADEPKAADLSPPDNEESASQTIPIQKLKKLLEHQESDD